MTTFPFSHLRVFVATSRLGVPAECARYISVDGSVPGAEITWDHHVTREAINLMAMPDLFDASGFDGVGTTLADTDALASVVAVMAGGKTQLPDDVHAVFEAACYRCDHLKPQPGISKAVDRRGHGLHAYVSEALTQVDIADTSAEFARLCALVADATIGSAPLPSALHLIDRARRRAEAMVRAGAIIPGDRVALIDLRGHPPVPPEILYEQLSAPVAVFVEPHPRGGLRYTVGVNPLVDGAPTSLRPALDALAAAERRHGLPVLSASPTPGSENWGGRSTVFGSPWNHPSRLTPERVVALTEEALATAQRS